MKINKLLLITIIITRSITGFGQLEQGKSSFTLAEAQQYALDNNVQIKNAKLDVESARQLVIENAAVGLPQVEAGAGYTNNLQLMTTLIPAEFFGGPPGTFQPVQFGTQHNANGSVTASQLIFSGPYIVGLQAASTYKELSEKSVIKTGQDIKEAVAKSYYSIILAEASRDAYGKNLETLNQRLEETRAMFESGFMEETDVDQLLISVKSMEDELRSAEQMVELSYKFLRYQMGYDLNAGLTITESLDDMISTLTTDLLEQPFVAEDHIDYALLNTQEQLAFLQLKRTRFEYFPMVNAYLTHQQMAMRQEFNFLDSEEEWFPSSMLGINITLPIFSSGMRRARVSQNRIELEKTINSKNDAIKGLELQVHQARIDFSSAYEKYLNQKESIEISKKVFERTTIKYQEGMASSLELTMVSDQVTASQAAFIAAAVELFNAKISLDKALGNL